jgi:hypothetical protein
MYEQMLAHAHLDELRERHKRLRRQSELSRMYREARLKHRFRSRQRR